MDVLKAFLFLFLFFFFPRLYAANDCPVSICGNNGFPIRFPFRLSPQEPPTCGYPGFTLGCNSQGMALLNLPSSGDFLISSINYRTQVVQLKDPYKCLPRRLLELNLSGSPFKAAAYYQNYTFLSCPPEFTSSGFTAIDCLGNSTSTILATSSSSTSLVDSLTVCKKMGTSLIPVSRPFQFDDGFSSDLNDDLELAWSVPNCDNCEGNGGLCHVFNNSTSIEAICSYNTQTGRKGVQIFKIMALCIAVPMILTSFGIAIFICCMDRREVGVHPNIRLQNLTEFEFEFESASSTATAAGLDESTIESYAKVIVGESRRLPAGPNHITCPICLSDYHAKETLRCIPECQHCFHSDCIDEWLRLKATCPVCRNSPSPSPARVNS